MKGLSLHLQELEEKQLLYLSQPTFDFFMCIETLCRQHFLTMSTMHGNTCREMLSAVERSDELHCKLQTALCDSENPDTIIGASSIDIIFMKLVTKWAQMRQREMMRAIFMMKHLKVTNYFHSICDKVTKLKA